MRTTLALVVFVACVLVYVSDAKRLTLKDNHRQLIELTDDRRHGAVPTAGVDSRDTKDAVADKTSTGGSNTSTKTNNNDEDDVNPTYKHYGATGSNSDSSTDTHRYYDPDGDRRGRIGSSSNDDGRKPKH